MNWARRLKRVFGIEIEQRCGGRLQVIASIEEPQPHSRAPAGVRRGGHADGLARPAGAAAGVAALIRQIVAGLVFSSASDGRRCAR
jgi:hypothetical protein